MRQVKLIAHREIRAALAKRSTMVAGILILIAMIAAPQIAAYFLNKGPADGQVQVTEIGLAPELQDFGTSLSAAGTPAGLTIETTVVDESAANAGLDDGSIEAWVGGTTGNLEIRYHEAPGDELLTPVISGAAQTYVLSTEISQLGGDPASVLASAAAASAPNVTFAVDNHGVGTDWGKLIAAWVILFLMFYAIMASGAFVSMGVVEKKSSRVVEILLATVRPQTLFGGKVLGIGIVSLSQVVIWAIAGLLSARFAGLLDNLSIPIGPNLAWSALWLLIGFATYVVVWGGLSALVSRQEDVGAVTTPMMLILFVAFYVGMYVPTIAPTATATVILSMVPFMAPFVMPIRQVFVAVPAWQIGVAVVASLLTILVLVWAAGKVYERGILHMGSRLSLKQVFARKA